MSVTVLRGDARALPLPDACVDLVVTSPPYFALRSYTDGGEHYAGQVGSEPTPAEFVDALIECTAEMVRVLKPTGSIFLNLGDKYVSTPPGNERSLANSAEHQQKQKAAYDRNWRLPAGYKQKSLMGLPWRYAIRCIDDLGLILRAEIIWSKPNGLPESVTDRVRRSHEQWFHMVKQPRYFAAVDEIREQYAPGTAERYRSGFALTGAAAAGQSRNAKIAKSDGGPSATNPLGKLPGSVWEIATQPLAVPAALGVDHFAAFPMEWPRRLISGWCPREVCTVCGEGRRPVVDKEKSNRRFVSDLKTDLKPRTDGLHGPVRAVGRNHVSITGYACACPDTSAPSTPGVVLDPFGGTGTTALVAHVLGRHGISVDMSSDYCRLAEWRTSDPGQIAAAMQVDKPPAQVVGQAELFDAAGSWL